MAYSANEDTIAEKRKQFPAFNEVIPLVQRLSQLVTPEAEKHTSMNDISNLISGNVSEDYLDNVTVAINNKYPEGSEVRQIITTLQDLSSMYSVRISFKDGRRYKNDDIGDDNLSLTINSSYNNSVTIHDIRTSQLAARESFEAVALEFMDSYFASHGGANVANTSLIMDILAGNIKAKDEPEVNNFIKSYNDTVAVLTPFSVTDMISALIQEAINKHGEQLIENAVRDPETALDTDTRDNLILGAIQRGSIPPNNGTSMLFPVAYSLDEKLAKFQIEEMFAHMRKQADSVIDSTRSDMRMSAEYTEKAGALVDTYIRSGGADSSRMLAVIKILAGEPVDVTGLEELKTLTEAARGTLQPESLKTALATLRATALERYAENLASAVVGNEQEDEIITMVQDGLQRAKENDVWLFGSLSLVIRGLSPEVDVASIDYLSRREVTQLLQHMLDTVPEMRIAAMLKENLAEFPLDSLVNEGKQKAGDVFKGIIEADESLREGFRNTANIIASVLDANSPEKETAPQR